jgi:hypothetical protein
LAVSAIFKPNLAMAIVVANIIAPSDSRTPVKGLKVNEGINITPNFWLLQILSENQIIK